jgi:hypothetical protein
MQVGGHHHFFDREAATSDSHFDEEVPRVAEQDLR